MATDQLDAIFTLASNLPEAVWSAEDARLLLEGVAEIKLLAALRRKG